MSKPPEIVVLLVEDDQEDAAIFARHIGRMADGRTTVVRASSEAEAASRLAADRIDLVFLDLNLRSGGSGARLLERFQEEGVDAPVIVVTGTGDETQAVEAMKAGAFDYISKEDLSPDLLERTMRNARRRFSLERERAHMVETLAELSVTDELTGLANRRRLIGRIEEELWRSQRTGRPFALLMTDLDHFKQVNDRHGHQAGDDVLRQCAAALQQNVRRTDLVARYGGEEFCVLLTEVTPDGARRAAEKLRKAVKTLPPPNPTMSIGVAQWERHGSAEEMLRRADLALYRAKRAGRDCVAVYGEEEEAARSP